MNPELFKIGNYTLSSYGVMIGLGILASYLMAVFLGKKLKVDSDKTATLFFWVFLASIVGGKFFFLLESPGEYLQNPSIIFKNFGNGFVFYGSLLFAIPTIIFYLRKNKIPVWAYMDVVAIFGPLLHFFGRVGCYMAGCCHGKACSNALGITFTNELSKAPLNIPLYPTQLMSAFMLLSIVIGLFLYRNKKKFNGQLFLIYIMVYAVGRGIIEIFRGDEARGYVIDGILSHSQFISILVLIGCVVLWKRLSKKKG